MRGKNRTVRAVTLEAKGLLTVKEYPYPELKENCAIIKMEYSGICGVIVIFTILLAYRNYYFNVVPILSENWKVLFIINTILYISLRSYKKIRCNSRKFQLPGA